jgi:hypothetical protein
MTAESAVLSYDMRIAGIRFSNGRYNFALAGDARPEVMQFVSL